MAHKADEATQETNAIADSSSSAAVQTLLEVTITSDILSSDM